MSNETTVDVLETPSEEPKEPVSGGLYNRFNFGVAVFAQKDNNSRYTQNAIRIEQDRTVATNGYYLAIVTVPKDEVRNFPDVPGHQTVPITKPVLFPVDVALNLAKEMPKKTTIPILQNAAPLAVPDDEAGIERIGFVWTDLSTAHPTITRAVAGQFPDYTKYASTTEPLKVIRLSVPYLLTIAKFMQDFVKSNRGYDQSVDITIPEDDGAPVEFAAHNSDTDQDAKVVLMRMRQ